jgi:Fe-S cluster assembly protein SufD
MSTAPLSRIAAGAPGREPTAPAVSKAIRLISSDPADFPLPSGREEEWRFTPLDRLSVLLSPPEPAGAGEQASVEVSTPEGVTAQRVSREHPRVGLALTPSDRLAALAVDRTPEPLLVSIPAGAQPDADVTVRVTGRGGISFDHVVIDVGRQARATVVFDHTGGGAFDGNVEICVGDGAELTVVSVQDWDGSALHTGVHAALVGRDARLRATVVTLGGSVVRLLPTVAFAGPGGDAELAGVFFTDAGQHHEHRLFVDHEEPHCRSRVTYKGALQGRGAHSVWIGDVLIGPGADGTDTYESNRNLVLTDGARADSVPNLEIQTGEILGAGHASATGRFDDEQLFYLMARGIPAAEARRLVVRGFFAEVIERIASVPLRERLLAAVDAELEAGAV